MEPLIGSGSIQYANGADWEERRKALYHTLRGEYLDTYYPTFLQIVDKTRRDWSTYQPDKQVSLTKECMAMAIKGIFHTCLLSGAFGDEEEIGLLTESYHLCFNELEARLHIGIPPAGSEREANFEKHASYIRSLARRVLKTQSGPDAGTVHVPFIEALVQMGAGEEQVCVDSAYDSLTAIVSFVAHFGRHILHDWWFPYIRLFSSLDVVVPFTKSGCSGVSN